MDELNLTEASELLTPLKAAFSIHTDNEEDDGLTKIPHGLTAKKDRRKSHIPSESSKNGFQLSPKRIPLTAPRPNVLNSFPINSMEGPKRQLFKEFQILKAHDSNEERQLNDSETLSGILKRKSSVFEDEANSSLSKIQKVDELFGDSMEVESVADNEEKEELSRIELNNDLGSSFVATQADETETVSKPTQSAFGNANILIQTPSRLTEPVALSPKTEQHSRVVDESKLLLDTTKSPNVDDSFAAESPLSHNVSAVAKDLNFLADLDLIKESSPQKVTETLSPNQRPLFTITQVHEIQNDFQKEVQKLEQSLREKSSNVAELNSNITEFRNKIFELEDDIQILAANEKKLVKERELLKHENDLYENDIKELKISIRMKDEKHARSTHAINKFKERVDELNNRIISKDNVIFELNEDIQSKSRAIDILNDRVQDFEDQASRLNTSLTEKLNEVEQISKEKYDIELSLAKLQQDIQVKSNELELFAANETELKSLNDEIQSRIAELVEQNKNNVELISQLNNAKDQLSNEISSIIAQYMETQSAQSNDIKVLKSQLSSKSKELLLKDVIVQGLTSGASTLKSTNEALRNEINSLKLSINSTKEELAEAQELLVIRKAEVDELNIEIESFKDQVTEYAQLTNDQKHEINELKQTNHTQDAQFQLQSEKLQELDMLLQKQETDHLSELEAAHAEMSNLQGMVSDRSNELYQLKEQKDSLSKENDLLKYEVESFKEDAVSFEQRVSSLRAKLNETKVNSDTLEAQISQLSKEKATLEAETDKRLQQLAEDLYIQYSKKHEQKVQVLKKGYETKWASKITKFEHENNKLKREIEGLNSQLEQEKVEKAEIIKLWDAFKNGEAA